MPENNRQSKTDLIWDLLIIAGLVIALAIICVPLFMISKYSFMSADDFSYMYQVGGEWKSSHSVIKNLIFEVKQSIETWKTWQGLYFADWLYFVVLSFFGESAYFITAFIGILSMIASGLLFAWFVFHKVQGAHFTKAVIAILPIVMLWILIPISGMEAFFWMISVILYTVPFALSVILSALIVYVLAENDEKKTMPAIICFILAFAIAGSNYVTGLPMFCIVGILMIVSIVTRNPKDRFMVALFVWYALCLALSVFSPGAAARQSAAGTGDTALHAVLNSFAEAFKYIKTWVNLPVILLNVFLIPHFFLMTKKSRISFRLPILFTIISFCVFASMFTPNLYALKIIGMYRVQNMYRFAMYLLIPLNIWYYVGWVRRKVDYTKNRKFKDAIKKVNPHVLGVIKLTVAFAASLLMAFTVYKYYGRTSTSVSAYYSLKENEAKIYSEEWEERLKVFNDESVTDPVFEPYSRKPYLLFFVDLSTDNTDWVNEAYARYFGKNSVTLSPSE